MPQMRIAKAIAESGVASRREAERLIEQGRVVCDGTPVTSPVFFVDEKSCIKVDGKIIKNNSDDVRLWKFYKPVGVLTTRSDPQKRKTIFDVIKLDFPRVIYVGRLDINSEGLLLLTNNGALARYFELPKSKIKRTYKVRVFGNLSEGILKSIRRGVSIDGFNYGKIDVEILKNDNSEKTNSKNTWLLMTLTEGKNREIRKILEHFGLKVNRLIRISYHKFQLDNMKPGDIEEVSHQEVASLLKKLG